MNCPSCDKSDRGGKACFPEKIVERPILFRLVKIASTIGDETAFPPTVGLYRNVLLNYEVNNHSYMYSSDGIPVMLVGGISFDDIANRPLYDGEPITSDTNIPDLTDEVETLEAQIQALATDFSYKGSVEDYAHLPTNAATGDVYTTADTGIIYVWDGNAWVALNEYPSVFTGTDGVSAGEEGLVPAPATTDIGKYLNADGTWKEVAGITELTSADYDYPSGSADGVALWELDEGLYSANDGVKVYLSSVASHDVSANPKMIMVVKDSGVASIYVFTESKVIKVATRASGTEVTDTWGSMLDSTDLAQTTGTSTFVPMSQNAVTSMVYNDPGTKKNVVIGGGTIGSATDPVVIGRAASVRGNYAIAIGSASGSQVTNAPGAISLGAFSRAAVQGQMDISLASATSQAKAANGYAGSGYRLLTGLYDPQTEHDAATKGYVDNNIPATFTTNEWNALWA